MTRDSSRFQAPGSRFVRTVLLPLPCLLCRGLISPPLPPGLQGPRPGSAAGRGSPSWSAGLRFQRIRSDRPNLPQSRAAQCSGTVHINLWNAAETGGLTRTHRRDTDRPRTHTHRHPQTGKTHLEQLCVLCSQVNMMFPCCSELQ